MDEVMKTMVKYAEEQGIVDGQGAAEWWIQDNLGGRSSVSGSALQTLAAKVKVAIEDGDPEILDSTPHADLSGQNAGVRSGQELFREAAENANAPVDNPVGLWDLFNDVCAAYEEQFYAAVEDKIVEECNHILNAHVEDLED